VVQDAKGGCWDEDDDDDGGGVCPTMYALQLSIPSFGSPFSSYHDASLVINQCVPFRSFSVQVTIDENSKKIDLKLDGATVGVKATIYNPNFYAFRWV